MGYTPNGKRVVAKGHPLSGSQRGSQARRTQEGGELGGKYLHSSGLAAPLATTRGCHAEPALCEASKKKGAGDCPQGKRAIGSLLAEPAPKGQVSGGQLRSEARARAARAKRPPTAAGTGSPATPDLPEGGTRSRAHKAQEPLDPRAGAPQHKTPKEAHEDLKGATRQADRRERDAGAPSNEEGRDPPKQSAGRGTGTPEALVNAKETSGSRWYYLKVLFCNFDRRDT